MNNRSPRVIASSCRAAGVVTILAAAAGCGPRNEFRPPPPPDVTVRQPVRQEVEETLQFTGTTKPVEAVDVRPRVQGFLEAVHFIEGQEVEAGDLLFEIDKRPFQAAVDQASAALALATAELGQAKAAEERAKALRDNAAARLRRAESAGAAVTQEDLELRQTEVASAQADYDAAVASVKSAKANIDAAQAQLDQAQIDLGFCDVKAPIAGRVGERMVDVGNLVGAGEATLLTRIVKYDPIYAYFTVSEAAYYRWVRLHDEEEPLRRNDREAADDRGVKVSLALVDEEDFPHEGIVDYADLGLDRSTGTYPVRGRFPNPLRIIAPGAYVRLQVKLDPVEALLIDETAIGRDQAGNYVRVVNAENVVETRRVDLGGRYGAMRVISGESISENDWVVVNGLQMARPGMEVNPNRSAAPSSESSTESEAARP